jgi:transposase
MPGWWGSANWPTKAWARIEPLLPLIEIGGRRWRDHRHVINTILWKLRARARAATCPSTHVSATIDHHSDLG